MLSSLLLVDFFKDAFVNCVGCTQKPAVVIGFKVFEN